MKKIIEITVGPTGETKVETKGFTGSDCQGDCTVTYAPNSTCRR